MLFQGSEISSLEVFGGKYRTPCRIGVCVLGGGGWMCVCVHAHVCEQWWKNKMNSGLYDLSSISSIKKRFFYDKIYIDSSRRNDSLIYDFPTLWWCESDTQSVETVLWILNIALSSGRWYADTLLWGEHWPRAVAPRQQHDREGKKSTHLQPSVTIQVFWFFYFQYSIQQIT